MVQHAYCIRLCQGYTCLSYTAKLLFETEFLKEASCGDGGFHIYRLFRYRMDEVYSSGVQADASIGVRTWVAIFQVSLDGASHFGQLATYLVMAACLQVYFQQAIVVRVSDGLVMQHGHLAARLLCVVSVAFVLLLVAH